MPINVLLLGERLLVGLPTGTPAGVPLPDFSDQGIWLLLGTPPDRAVITCQWHDLKMFQMV